MSKAYLLIGAIPTNNPNSYGGTTVLMKQMLDFFEEERKSYIFIQANKYEGLFAIFKNVIYILYYLVCHIKKTDIVMVNVARNGAFILSPVIYLFTKLNGKKFVFRMFGGNFISLYKNSRIKRLIANQTFMKADIMFFETKEILKFVKIYNTNVFWFPNTRKQGLEEKEKKNYLKRFVFISSVKQSKGIDEIIEASMILDSSYTIDIYGPIQDNKYSVDYFNSKNINYKGTLKPNDVLRVLSEYDVLLLPTFHSGEGYPGIIIEGYSLGIPCISTKWKAIPEIVDHNETGFLIQPHNVIELIHAIQYFNIDNYKKLSKNSLNKFTLFKYENVYNNVTSICENL